MAQRRGRNAKLNTTLRKALAPLVLAVSMVLCAPAHVFAQSVNMLIATGPYYLPIFLASENGYFKEEGLTVNVRIFPSGTDAMLAFRGIGAEFLVAGDAPSLVLWEGQDVVGIAPIYASPDNLFGVVRADIGSAADLKGKKIATRKDSTADYFLTTYLKLNNVKPSDVNIINLSPEENVPALLSGNIDGFFIWRPYPTLALKIMGDKAHVLTTSRGVYLEQIYLTANRKFAEANPNTVSKVLVAIKKAIAFVDQDPAQSAAIVAAKLKGTVDVVMPVIDTRPYTLQYGPENREQLRKLVAFLVENQKLKEPVDIEKAVDTRYLKSVDAKLVPQ